MDKLIFLYDWVTGTLCLSVRRRLALGSAASRGHALTRMWSFSVWPDPNSIYVRVRGHVFGWGDEDRSIARLIHQLCSRTTLVWAKAAAVKFLYKAVTHSQNWRLVSRDKCKYKYTSNNYNSSNFDFFYILYIVSAVMQCLPLRKTRKSSFESHIDSSLRVYY